MSTSAPTSHRFRHVARVVIEFTTPFHVGTGEGDYGADALVVTDVNGLPAIPGSSLAGALRAAFLAHTGKADATENLFGFQKQDKGCGSRLSLTWAAIHNHNDQPVEGLLARSCVESDEVLSQALSVRIRDHVRLSHRGAAAHRGKFDEQPVAAGHHFTFELELVSDRDRDPDWDGLMAALGGSTLRLGGKSRRGYGAFKVVRINAHVFNLQDPNDFAAYAAHPASLCQPAPALTNLPVPTPNSAADTVTITLRLQPRGYWMFGGGEDLPPHGTDPADMAPTREERIVWSGSTGRVEKDVLLLPASAIKGAVSHRVAFHCNRLAHVFAERLVPCSLVGPDKRERRLARVTTANRAVRQLFGFVPDMVSMAGHPMARGRVLIDDLFWSPPYPPQQRVPHVSIDRFTGGAADSKLFSERPLWHGDFPELKLTILGAEQISPATRQALRAALDDLAHGRLALGAGAGRGLGYFEPKPGAEEPVECSPDDDWFDRDSKTSTNPSHAQT